MKALTKPILYAALVAMAVAHQDVWFWSSRRLVFGVLPFELAYHGVYTLAVAGLMWLLARHAWSDEVTRAGADPPESKR